MAKQLFYEEVQVGMDIPGLAKHPTTRQLVKWAGASDDYNEIHFDKDFAQSVGMPGVIVHGWLTLSFICQMLTDWIGDKGKLRRISCKHQGMLFPGQEIRCKGKVLKKYVQDSEHLVDCEVWAENKQGERTTPGAATILLPAKK
jgi:acyl dehydratase